jgi:2-polyprenyl-3-methyl-5-hydroxy-6-metoxy-1,4-benzoquinol methylase
MTELKIYDQYQKYGVENYYKLFASKYSNPHEHKIVEIYKKFIKPIINEKDCILDLACGNGLISQLVNRYNKNNLVQGCDPYFTNKYCTMNYSFIDIVQGNLTNHFDIVICCYAYHLLDLDLEHDFLTNIALITKTFIIISPSKKIQIKHSLWKIFKEERIDKITIIILNKEPTVP